MSTDILRQFHNASLVKVSGAWWVVSPGRHWMARLDALGRALALKPPAEGDLYDVVLSVDDEPVLALPAKKSNTTPEQLAKIVAGVTAIVSGPVPPEVWEPSRYLLRKDQDGFGPYAIYTHAGEALAYNADYVEVVAPLGEWHDCVDLATPAKIVRRGEVVAAIMGVRVTGGAFEAPAFAWDAVPA